MIRKQELIETIIQDHRTVNRLFNQYDSQAWMGICLSIAQMKSLFFIANEGSVNFRKLASALNVTPSNVTGIIDRLVEKELVTRTENPQDRRMLLLRLTEKGEALINSLRESRVNRISSVLHRMTSKELSSVARGFAVLKKAVENFDV